MNLVNAILKLCLLVMLNQVAVSKENYQEYKIDIIQSYIQFNNYFDKHLQVKTMLIKIITPPVRVIAINNNKTLIINTAFLECFNVSIKCLAANDFNKSHYVKHKVSNGVWEYKLTEQLGITACIGWRNTINVGLGIIYHAI